MSILDFLARPKTDCLQCEWPVARVPQSIFPIAETHPDDFLVCLTCRGVGHPSYAGLDLRHLGRQSDRGIEGSFALIIAKVKALPPLSMKAAYYREEAASLSRMADGQPDGSHLKKQLLDVARQLDQLAERADLVSSA